uniref:C2 domain-containing protein n=1 Tax=Steinernema glaseri TaxID=37863 RepID=A0A1I7Y837_9BILA
MLMNAVNRRNSQNGQEQQRTREQPTTVSSSKDKLVAIVGAETLSLGLYRGGTDVLRPNLKNYLCQNVDIDEPHLMVPSLQTVNTSLESYNAKSSSMVYVHLKPIVAHVLCCFTQAIEDPSVALADLSLSEDRPNEIEFHISKLTVDSENSSVFTSLRPQLFLSVEFFDFELQTTDVFPGPEVLLDFSTIYDVVVSNLFLHYVETDGITVELYEARANTYSLCGTGVIKLRNLVSLKAESTLKGEISMISSDRCSEIGTLSYSLSVKEDLLRALKAHKKQTVARTLLIEEDGTLGESNELVATIHRCHGLNFLTKDEKTPSSYVVYELFDFEPVSSKTVYNNANPEYSTTNTFKVPLSDAVHNYLKSTELTISVVQVAPAQRLIPSSAKPNILGRVSVPLFLLARNQSIVGTFSLTSGSGDISSATIDISIRWRFDYKYAISDALPGIPTIKVPSSMSSESGDREGEEFLKELEEHQERNVKITLESDTSSDESDYQQQAPAHSTPLRNLKQLSMQSIESEENSTSTIISNAIKNESTPHLAKYRSSEDDEDFAPVVRSPPTDNVPASDADEKDDESAEGMWKVYFPKSCL